MKPDEQNTRQNWHILSRKVLLCNNYTKYKPEEELPRVDKLFSCFSTKSDTCMSNSFVSRFVVCTDGLLTENRSCWRSSFRWLLYRDIWKNQGNSFMTFLKPYIYLQLEDVTILLSFCSHSRACKHVYANIENKYKLFWYR